MSEDSTHELQKEWRAIVLDKLSHLEIGQNELKRDIVDIKTSFARQNALEDLRVASRAELEVLRTKIDDLSAFKFKLVGIAIGVNTVLTALGYLFFKVH